MAHELIAKILCHTEKYITFFGDLTGKTLMRTHQRAIVVLAVGIFLFDNLREKRSVPLTNSQALHVLKILAARWLKIPALYNCTKALNTSSPHFHCHL